MKTNNLSKNVAQSEDLAPNKLGIENIKAVFGLVANLLLDGFGIDQNNDGKIVMAEIFAYATAQVFKVTGVIPAFKQFDDEFRDLTDEELTELIAYVQTLDFLPPGKDSLEEFVKKTVNMLNYNYRYGKYSLSFFQSIRKKTAE